MRIILFSIYMLHTISFVKAQGNNLHEIEYTNHIDKARKYSELALYVQSAKELKSAISLAKKENWEEREIDASISLAELMRKTRNFNKGFDIIFDLKGTEKYPKLHVRKLGRLAALYHEGDFTENFHHLDSVEANITKALKIAEKLDFNEEKASLYNELGFLLSNGKGEREESMQYFIKSANLFLQLKDTHNYVGAMTHVLENYIFLNNNSKVDSLFSLLQDIVKGRNWYSAEIDLYSAIGVKSLNERDSLSYYKWNSKVKSLIIKHLQLSNTNQMNAFKVVYENEKFKNKAAKSANELVKQTAITKELLIYLSIFGLMIIGFIILFIRERRLKKEVKIANDKFQMLIVESNHRIKNNLQMIISMLQYASKDLDDKNGVAFKKMSTKIQTISALHKHLYLDIHNERVSIKAYFSEIIKLYSEISDKEFCVNTKFADVNIKSQRIVYFGLIFNEMLSNTMEHNNSDNIVVNINITKIGKGYIYNYFDNSIHSKNVEKGMGSILIKQLIQRVGGSKYSFIAEKGQYKFEFNA